MLIVPKIPGPTPAFRYLCGYPTGFGRPVSPPAAARRPRPYRCGGAGYPGLTCSGAFRGQRPAEALVRHHFAQLAGALRQRYSRRYRLVLVGSPTNASRIIKATRPAGPCLVLSENYGKFFPYPPARLRAPGRCPFPPSQEAALRGATSARQPLTPISARLRRRGCWPQP